jgi:hypothetical protein
MSSGMHKRGPMDSARCIMCLQCFTQQGRWLTVPPGPAIAMLANTLAEACTLSTRLCPSRLWVSKGNLKEYRYYGDSGKNSYNCKEHDVLLLRR